MMAMSLKHSKAYLDKEAGVLLKKSRQTYLQQLWVQVLHNRVGLSRGMLQP